MPKDDHTRTTFIHLLNKKDITSNYARTNNLHVMWGGSVFSTYDGHDLINVVFQCMHLNRIIIGLKMFGPFKELHRKVIFLILWVQFEPLEFFYSYGGIVKVEW
jgi:hypothetical protein